IVGFIAPLLRFVLFGMPPIFPTGVAMAFELAAYGVLSGILYRMLDKKVINIYISLVLAMLGGRIVWGVVQFILSLFVGFEFTFATFLAGAFVSAVPGIICHIAIIPVIVIALRKTKLMQDL
ncbi:MAG: ECF transporter S component, partial [Christensenellaceae bacterium]|nr:ECF transporter S component [Christensenellaceae bacterium]